jgi:hypothetical protein
MLPMQCAVAVLGIFLEDALFRRMVDIRLQETAFIESLIADPGKLFDRNLWPLMRGFARIVPDGDLLPLRIGREDGEGGLDWHVALVAQPDRNSPRVFPGPAPAPGTCLRPPSNSSEFGHQVPSRLHGVAR